MYLQESNLKPAAEIVVGAVFQDMTRAAMDRRPPEADPEDQPHVAAAKGFTRKGYELALETLRKLPFDPKPAAQPVIPETITDTRD